MNGWLSCLDFLILILILVWVDLRVVELIVRHTGKLVLRYDEVMWLILFVFVGKEKRRRDVS